MCKFQRKNYFFLSILLILVSQLGYSQVSNKKNTLYFQYNHYPGFSFNYDRIILHLNHHLLSLRGGVSFDKNIWGVPIGINYIRGKRNHHGEISLIAMPAIKSKNSPATSDTDDKLIFIIPTAGYRYQKASGGIFFKLSAGTQIAIDPPESDVFNFESSVSFYASAGAGWSF